MCAYIYMRIVMYIVMYIYMCVRACLYSKFELSDAKELTKSIFGKMSSWDKSLLNKGRYLYSQSSVGKDVIENQKYFFTLLFVTLKFIFNISSHFIKFSSTKLAVNLSASFYFFNCSFNFFFNTLFFSLPEYSNIILHPYTMYSYYRWKIYIAYICKHFHPNTKHAYSINTANSTFYLKMES